MYLLYITYTNGIFLESAYNVQQLTYITLIEMTNLLQVI